MRGLSGLPSRSAAACQVLRPFHTEELWAPRTACQLTVATFSEHPFFLPSSKPGTCCGTFRLFSPPMRQLLSCCPAPVQAELLSTHLEVLLIQDFFSPLDQESGTHVEMEVREPFWFRLGRQRTELGLQALTSSWLQSFWVQSICKVGMWHSSPFTAGQTEV